MHVHGPQVGATDSSASHACGVSLACFCADTPYQYTVKRPVCVTKTKCIPYTDYKEVDVSYEVTVPVETKKPVIK